MERGYVVQGPVHKHLCGSDAIALKKIHAPNFFSFYLLIYMLHIIPSALHFVLLFFVSFRRKSRLQYLFLECIWVSSLWPDVPLRVKKSKMADLKWERNEWKIFRFHRQCPAWPTTLSWLDMITIKTVSTFFNFYWNCTVYCAKHPYLKVNPKCLVIDIWWWW